jgi:hypothetical protein
MIEAKNIDTPDDKRSFEHGDLAIVNVTGMTLARAEFRPGWRWSTDVKPMVGTASCQAAHAGVILSGRFRVRMDDGEEREFGPGDVHVVSPGHDAWVVGDEPVVALDFASTGSALSGRVGRCPCGVEFRISGDDQLDHLVAAIQQHALGSHGHELSREHVLAEVTA